MKLVMVGVIMISRSPIFTVPPSAKQGWEICSAAVQNTALAAAATTAGSGPVTSGVGGSPEQARNSARIVPSGMGPPVGGQ